MDVTTLCQRATSGLRPNPRLHFKPSMLYTLLECPFNLWCDYHAPAKERVDETTRYETLRIEWGRKYEEAWVRANYPDAVRVPDTFCGAALEKTCQAMLQGARAIHGPQLWLLSEEMYGTGDLLVRYDDHPSDLGPYHYRVFEIKRSKKVKLPPEADDYKVLQGFAYHRMLSRLQGYRPPTFTLVLRDGSVEVPCEGLDLPFDRILELWRSIRDGQCRPDLPDPMSAKSPWRIFIRKILERRRDVTLAPGVTQSMRKRLLEALHVRTVKQVERLSLEKLTAALGEKAARRVYYRIEAKRRGHPVLAPGARVELPRRKRHIYFDFETCDELHPRVPPHVYMIGLYDGERGEYRVFTARGAADEARIFREFFDYVGKPEEACLYHWTDFEVKTMQKEVAPRHPSLACEIQRLVAACVDLKEAVRDKVFFAARTYSIKEVAPTIGFRWKQEDVDAFESMVLYWKFLESGDGGKLERIVQYNRDDCEAMVAVDRWLQDRIKVPGPL